MKALRKARGLTQKALADKMEPVEFAATISRWEKRDCTPHKKNRERIAKALKVSLDELESTEFPCWCNLPKMDTERRCVDCGSRVPQGAQVQRGEMPHENGPSLRSTIARRKLDLVNHPPHYTTGKIEVIDFIEDQDLPYHLANAVKYIARCRHKGTEAQDINKAIWYLQRYRDMKKE